jgi:uncharacterized alpha-E superfamily protein/transglutaminase-like putative cysteine protease
MSTLLASTAQSLYWAGRYLERAGGMARIVLVHGDTHVDLPVGEDVGWQPLLAVAGVEDRFQTVFGDPHRSGGTSQPAGPREADVAEFLLAHPDNPSSILRAVTEARDCLRLTRPVITTEAWELCNELRLALADLDRGLPTREGRVGWLRRVVSDCEQLAGSLWGTMRRDGGVAFVRMGQSLERADLICRVLAVRAIAVTRSGTDNAYDHIRAMGVLRSLASYEGFRRVSATREQTSLLRFLLLDEAYPRSVAACLSDLREQLKDLPHNESALSACSDASVHLIAAPVTTDSETELGAFLAGFQQVLSDIHHKVVATYFHEIAMSSRASNSPNQNGAAARSGCTDSERQSPGRAYRITHRTVYRYQSNADRSYNEAHLRPRDTPWQRSVEHALLVVPEPLHSWERTDSFGNHVTRFTVTGAFDSLTVTAQSYVLIKPAPVLPKSMPWESVVAVLERDRRFGAQDARRYRAESRLVPSPEPVATYARESFAPNRSLVLAVSELCARIHEDFEYEPGFTSVSTPMVEAFEARKGVCQDFAHVAIACLRSVGLAARYVSGYLETAPPTGQKKVVGADASHAWISVYLPSWGWIDFDPTNDQMVSDRYITVAWGLDYWDVSPLRGIVEGGGPSHQLEVSVDVEAEHSRS